MEKKKIEIEVEDNKLEGNATLFKNLPKSDGDVKVKVSGMEMGGNSALFDFDGENDV